METIDQQTGEVTQRSIKAVAQKMTAAMADMDAYASKDGKNTFHKYEYTSIAQYMAHVRSALVKHGLVIIPSLINITDYEDATTDVLMEYTIIDSESGEYLKTRTVGRGQDVSSTGKRLDKGPYKAYSGAFKYFLAETFMIASGDDPDESGREVSKGQRQAPTQPVPKGGEALLRQHWSADEKKRLSLEKNVTKIGATIEDFFKVHDLADWEDFTRYEGEPADAWSYFKEQWQAKNGVKEGV